MDRLELGMCQSDMNKDGQAVVVMEKLLQLVKSDMHLRYRRWDERGPLNRRVFCADPVLDLAKLARAAIRATAGPEELRMDLAD